MIGQVKFAKSVRFFEHNFKQRWGVNAYSDKYAPCLFVGVYSDEDIDTINTHKGLKVILNTGEVRDRFIHIDPKNVVVCRSKQIPFNLQYKTKDATFELKDYSMFEPVRLGRHIYCYIRNIKDKARMGADLLESLGMDYPIIYGEVAIKNTLMPIERAWQFYKNSFVNIKITHIGAWVTATEMACMGRKTISVSKAPFCINFRDTREIKELIKKEAEKIGTVQPSCIGDFFDTGDEWKQENFWI